MSPRIQVLVEELPRARFGTSRPPLSEAYITQQRLSCLWLLMQLVVSARSLALPSAGSNIAARMAMMAMTTNSSIKVKPRRAFGRMLQMKSLRLLMFENKVAGFRHTVNEHFVV